MMSPDGRYALGQTYDFKDPQARLVDLSTGTAVPLDIKGNGLGWSPDDSVFALDRFRAHHLPRRHRRVHDHDPAADRRPRLRRATGLDDELRRRRQARGRDR